MNMNFSGWDKDSDKYSSLRKQQFTPGRPTPPPGPPGRDRQPPSGPPGRDRQPPSGPPGRDDGPSFGPPGVRPPSAPPNFTPDLPRMEGQQPFTGPGGSAQFGRGGVIIGGGSRNFRGCLNRFTFVWLFNGSNFWFYPVAIRGTQFVEGFRWRRNRWEYDRININRILFFRCF